MPVWARIVFFAFTSVIAVGVHVYIYRRLVRDVTEHRGLRRLGAVAIVLLAVAAAAARPLARLLPEYSFRPLMVALLVWLGFVINLLMVLLAVDFARWAKGRWDRRKREAAGLPPGEPQPVDTQRRRVIAAGVSIASSAVAGGLTTYGTWRAFEAPDVFEVPVRIPGLPKTLEGLRITHLTDVHIGAVIQRRFIEELVFRANATRPDLLVITGDLVDGTPERLGHFAAPLKNLQARFGTWFATGNHDYYSGAEDWVHALQGMGIPSLRNRRVELGDAGGRFELIGVDDWRYEYDLDRALAGRDPSRASVLLCHQPANIPEVARRGVGLMMSGHTHGGQIFPGNAVSDLIWGDRSTGLSKLEQTHFWVSRGCGFVGPPMRLGAPPELPVIVLLAA